MSHPIEKPVENRTPKKRLGRDEVIVACVRAAADLFSERNPSQVSVRDIAARAGVSHALVHRYLGSKENMFVQALELLRWESGKYWEREGAGMEASFAQDLPPGRYVRAVMRAQLDSDLIGTVEGLRLPRAEHMVHAMASVPRLPDERPFDPRLILSATLAMTVAMSLASDFFLEQGGFEAAERHAVQPELRRLVQRMLGLADTSASTTQMRDAG